MLLQDYIYYVRNGRLCLSAASEFTLDFSGVRVAKRLVFCVVFCTSLFGLCPFSFGHCIASLSSIYGL